MHDEPRMLNDPAKSNEVVGRLAPSPTGAQHLGNARTFLLAWWLARSSGGKLLLRIEDLDTPRIKPWATAQAIEDLKWLGIDWDSVASKPGLMKPEPMALATGFDAASTRLTGPEASNCDSSYWIQSDRIEHYNEVLNQLKSSEAIYPCTCTRSDIDASQSAPHEDFAANLDGAVYPGTCSLRSVDDAKSLDAKGQKYAWRFRLSSQSNEWTDLFSGRQQLTNPSASLGDFVVARSSGSPAYQIAVVVDDHAMGVNQVVRGSDLIYSTYRQLAIYQLLGWSPPSYYHFPLVVGPDGKRLAKRHGDTRLSHYREQGVAPERIIGFLAYRSGWIDRDEPISARDLLSIDLPSRQSQEVLVVNGF